MFSVTHACSDRVQSRVVRAAARCAAAAWHRTMPDSLFKRIWGDRMPTTVSGVSRGLAVDVHQLRAGHCSISSQYLHRIGRLPTRTCPGCPRCPGRPDPRCPAARCAVCKEEADTPEHILLRCPCLAGLRLKITGNIFIHIHETQLQSGGVITALACDFRHHLEPLADGRP
jgi:hypothetical protein